jgi:acetyl-CoA carboxylase carboxyltransferase component
MGFSKTAPILPSLWRREIMVNMKKKSTVKTMDRARKTGVAAVGDVRSAGAMPDKTVRSRHSQHINMHMCSNTYRMWERC